MPIVVLGTLCVPLCAFACGSHTQMASHAPISRMHRHPGTQNRPKSFPYKPAGHTPWEKSDFQPSSSLRSSRYSASKSGSETGRCRPRAWSGGPTTTSPPSTPARTENLCSSSSMRTGEGLANRSSAGRFETLKSKSGWPKSCRSKWMWTNPRMPRSAANLASVESRPCIWWTPKARRLPDCWAMSVAESS